MIDHISLRVGDLERSRAFYDRVLATLGHGRVMDIDEADYEGSGYGPGQAPAFAIGAGKEPMPAPRPEIGQHVAFTAADRATVDRFHQQALAAGGADNGAPGLRPEYHLDYYAAFIIDPDGYHIEAVCHKPA